MNGPAQYFHFGFILISLANLLVIALLIVVFILAVALRRPEKQRLFTLEALPTLAGPAFVRSPAYFFGENVQHMLFNGSTKKEKRYHEGICDEVPGTGGLYGEADAEA